MHFNFRGKVLCGGERLPNQTILAMKITAFFLLLGCLQVSANGIAQGITLSEKNTPLKKVFIKISKQTGVSIMYDEALLKQASPVTIDVINASIDQVLNICLKNQAFTYSIVKNTIIIRKIEKQPDLEPPPPEPLYNEITGVVRDENGQPLQAVSVSVEGSTRGTTTDGLGAFSLKARKGETLQFSIIGYAKFSIKLGNDDHLMITLKKEIANIEDVVVIGYGTQKKATLTGSVSSISAKQLAGRPTTKTTDLLQGIAPGVQVQRSNQGRLMGTNSTITIRGVTSRSDPGVLVVIDGVPQSDDASYSLNNINPDDIENISILKDAQAAIYGARAAGGVILITTKSGRTEKPTINYSTTYTLQKPSLEKQSVNVLQLVEMMNEAYVNDEKLTNGFTHIVDYINQNHLTMDEIKKNDGKYVVQWPFDQSANFVFGDYYWPGIMYHTAPLQIHNISVSGKSKRFNYFNSVGYEDQNSMLRYGSNYNKRFFARLKNDYDVTDWLTIKTNIGLDRQKVVEPYNFGSIEFWQGLIWPVFMPFTPKGNYYNFGSHQNPIGYAEKGGDVTEINYRVKTQIGFVLTPLRNLSITGDMANNYDLQEGDWASLGFDMYNENDVFSYNSTNDRNSAGAYYNRTRNFVGNLFANYKIDLLNAHHFELLAGYSHEEVDFRNFGVQRNLGLISEQLPTFGLGSSTQQFNSESKTDRALESVFSRLNYNYKGRYILEANFRYDGSSRFAPGHKWSPFYGVSGAWTVTQENFMKRYRDILDVVKIRASWGQLGNEASIGLYDYIPQVNIGGSYPFGSSGSPLLTQAATLAGLGSDTRTWERVDSKNIGVDVGVLKSRLTASFDYYIKDNANMFYSKEFPQVLGVTAPSINGAHVRTKGWEVAVNWKDKIGQISYNAGFNISNSTNIVIQLADSRIPFIGENDFVEGYPAYSYFGYRYDGFIQSQDELNKYNASITSGIPQGLKQGDSRFKDLNGDGKLTPQVYQLGKDGSPTSTSGDMAYLGDAGQHYLFGFNAGLEYKNFYLNAFFQGVLKWMVYDGNRAFEADSWPQLSYFYHNTWEPNHMDARYPRLSTRPDINNNNYSISDASYMLYNNKYIRLKNIQVGYTIPSQITTRYKLNELRIYFSGTDVFEKYNLPGVFDPEKPFAHFITAFPREYSFGLNLTF
ncbi:MAG: TonB-dependent receptor [Bacteroidota bacterium]|nr:TonB-dependent receptor [Bacteroidota bacterium]